MAMDPEIYPCALVQEKQYQLDHIKSIFANFVVQGLRFLWLLLEEEELNPKNQKMGTNQKPKEILKNTVAPSTALAYLDPQYWFFFFPLITPTFR